MTLLENLGILVARKRDFLQKHLKRIGLYYFVFYIILNLSAWTDFSALFPHPKVHPWQCL